MPEPVTAAVVSLFLGNLLGEPIREGAGWLTDIIHEQRLRRLGVFLQEYENLRLKLGISGLRPVPPKLAIPILNAASIEDEGYVTKRYACLLANFSNPQYHGEMTPAFQQLLASMSPLDLRLLTEAYRIVVESGPDNSDADHISSRAYFWVTAKSLSDRTGLDLQCVLPNLENLERLRCLVANEHETHYYASDPMNRNYRWTPTSFHITPLGELLLLTCDEDFVKRS